MSYLNTIFFVTIISLLPLLMYLFYIAHNRNIDKKEKKIVLSFVIYSTFYFILKAEALFLNECLILAMIPIVIAYARKRIPESIIMSIVLIIYMVFTNNMHITLECVLALVVISLIDIYVLKIGDDILKYHESYKELLEDNMIKSSLFKIAHEVKNPLAVSLGYLEMLDINNSDQCKKYIPIIKEEINHSLLILQDFSDIGKIKIEKDIMDVNMLVEHVSMTLRLLLKERKIGLKLDLIDDDIYIEGDFTRLTQVIINLIKNSMEAIKDKGIISITTSTNGNNVNILIADNGEGMDTEILSKITEPFFTTKNNGTGLGVFLSHEIIKRHNGQINYSSEIRKGTKVHITLPMS